MAQVIPRVSVIVPIRNTAEFLPQCLQTLKDQIMDDLEIICVDDGSSDNSLEIAKMYQKHDPRMKIIEKKYTGYGDSMNRAIKEATGEYVGFVESTDFVNPEMFVELYSLAKNQAADVAKSNFFELDEEGNMMREIILPEETKTAIDPIENTKIFYQFPSIWSAVYRREFLLQKKIRFHNKRSVRFQDAGFNFKALAMADRIILTDKPYLHYRKNAERLPAMTGGSFSMNEVFADVEDYLKNMDVWEDFASVFEAVKFAEYYWYMSTVPKRDLKDFILRMRAEFFDAKQRRYLQKSFFQNKHWKEMNRILKYPPTVFISWFDQRDASLRGSSL